jgi:hypothetical protein
MASYSWNSIFGRDPNLRAADADREATAERLRQSHAEGRLDTDELQQRLERCYGAKTVGELHELVTDLPREAEIQPRLTATGGTHAWRWRLVPFMPLLVALVALTVITGGHAGWLFIPLLFLWRACCWGWRPWHPAGRGGPGHWV